MTTAPHREHISKDAKIASLLCVVLGIPYEHQLLMTAHQVQSLAQWDHHPIRVEAGGSSKFFNIRAMTIMAHRVKTATIDVPEIGKGKRIRKKEAESKVRLEIKAGRIDESGPIPRSYTAFPACKKKIGQRANAWPQGRKMQSRGFQRRRP